jgi:2-methylcitrate dehydratase PrpD
MPLSTIWPLSPGDSGVPQQPAHAVVHGTDLNVPPLARRLAQSCMSPAFELDDLLADKARTCLQDLIGCAFESLGKPWSRQAQALAAPMASVAPAVPGGLRGATVIGQAQAVSPLDAAFVNAVMGHGLVREDMHSASISHLGVAVLPAVLALSQQVRVSGRELLSAVVVGYEVGARVGGALMDARIARVFRPTGITGPLAAAAAGSRLLGLTIEQTTHALALAANTVGGFNEWGHTGGSEMYFHVGHAARNGVSSALLARAGAFGSPTALDGQAGLFASHGKREQAAGVNLFDGGAEIMSVYHKPVPACNFAQTATQAALALAQGGQCPVEQIRSITIRVPSAGAHYPGCDFRGPYAHVLQAKMSIQYNVVAALMRAGVTEANFDLLQDPTLHALLACTRLEIDDDMTHAYPGHQGGGVEVTLQDGRRLDKRLVDVVNASPQEVYERFRSAAQAVVGPARAEQIGTLLDGLERLDDAGQLAAALAPAASS